jgi:uncharacterized BrkB/YihY/UPF0761 family membrane protein
VIGYRILNRYTRADVGLLAVGTAYYLFLALFALLAFAYGLVATIGADAIAATLTDALEEALPGLVGSEGIDPDTLRRTGQTASVVGLAVLLVSGSGAIVAASTSVHRIYGAPPDPRLFLLARARLVGWLLVVGPLVLLSFAATSLSSALLDPVLAAVGLDPIASRGLVLSGSVALGFVIDVLVLWLLLGVLGGIRPDRRPRLLGAATGAVLVGVIKLALTAIVGWAVARPQYGAFAAPIAALLVLSLLANALYVAAAVVAGVTDRDVPLDALMPTPAD